MNRPILTQLLCIVAIVVAGDVVVSAQTTLPKLFTNSDCQTLFRDKWNAYHIAMQHGDQPGADNAKTELKKILDPREQADCVSDLLIKANPQQVKNQTTSVMVARFISVVEKQAGASVSSAGSTSAISKNFTSQLLSAANEYGALSSSTSGQTTTLSGSLDGLYSPFAGGLNGLISECAVALVQPHCVSSTFLNLLGRVNYSASLDLSQPSTITGTATEQATGGTQQITGTQGGSNFSLSQFTAKVLLWGVKPSPSDLQTAINNKGLKNVVPNSFHQLSGFVSGNEFATWQEATANLLLNASVADIQGTMNQRVALLPGILANGDDTTKVIQAALNFASAVGTEAELERQIYNAAIWAKPIISFEYDYNTPANQPTNSTFRLIYGQSLKGWKITANGAASIYNSQPSSSIPGVGRLRDAQFGAEGDHPVPAIGALNSSLFSMAYYFQDQTSPAILNVTPGSPLSGISFTGLSSSATQVFTQAGYIHLGQIKLTLGSSSYGWSLPISVSVSNRSELINNKIMVRPQVGISYSFDSSLSK